MSNSSIETLTSGQRNEFLSLVQSLETNSSPNMIKLYFETLGEWKIKYGDQKDLLEAVCRKILLDKSVGQIYLCCPELIPLMERLRKGEPIRKLKITMSEESRRWWYALLIVRVLLKCGRVLSHIRLVRWLSHRADARQLREGLEYLRNSGIVETFHVNGSDPIRPITWHRLIGIEESPATKPLS
jgi:hypothetical protein